MFAVFVVFVKYLQILIRHLLPQLTAIAKSKNLGYLFFWPEPSNTILSIVIAIKTILASSTSF